MKSKRNLLFSSFSDGKLRPPAPGRKPMTAAQLAIIAAFACVVLGGGLFYLWPRSGDAEPQGVRLSVAESNRSPEQGRGVGASEPQVFWSVRVLTVGRVADGADPAPLVQRALKSKKQLEEQGFSPVYALSDTVSGKREYWVSVGRSRNPDELKDLERRLERTSIGSDRPFQDAYVCRVAVPPR